MEFFDKRIYLRQDVLIYYYHCDILTLYKEKSKYIIRLRFQYIMKQEIDDLRYILFILSYDIFGTSVTFKQHLLLLHRLTKIKC